MRHTPQVLARLAHKVQDRPHPTGDELEGAGISVEDDDGRLRPCKGDGLGRLGR